LIVTAQRGATLQPAEHWLEIVGDGRAWMRAALPFSTGIRCHPSLSSFFLIVIMQRRVTRGDGAAFD
jgi:hypothetical protein